TALLSLAGLKPRVLCEILKTGVFVRSCLDNTKEAHEFEQTHGLKRVCDTLQRENFKDWNDLLKRG
ncbi:MAG: hypothetical protein LBC71_02185, partial [Oscillospiraceae bacterium]|nr:hypothetical protein [Oscillospiraceae bacterium]